MAHAAALLDTLELPVTVFTITDLQASLLSFNKPFFFFKEPARLFNLSCPLKGNIDFTTLSQSFVLVLKLELLILV